ncbi:MAG: DUF4135 domain-containing protein [Acidobacteriaceae bacterium]
MIAEPGTTGWLTGAGRDAGVLLPGWQGNLTPADAGLLDATMLPPPLDGLLQPLLADALMDLKQRAGSALLCCGGAPIPLEQILAILRLRLTGVVSLPLALACEDAKVEEAEEGLAGDFASRAWTDCRMRFPLLAPLLAIATRGWVRATEVFLRRLDRDRVRLARWLGVASLPPIRALAGTGSDSHDGGSTVLLVSFASGQGLYYKPRPVAGEFLWHALLAELAASAPDCSLPAARVLPGSGESPRSDSSGELTSGYGWMEALAADAAPAGDGYWRGAGGLLCLAQQFALTDLHAKNVVPQETGPAVVDAECLGSAAIFHKDEEDDAAEEETDEVERVIERLLATGLLGSTTLSGRSDSEARCDLSGLFARTASIPSLRLPYWQAASGRLPQLGFTPARLRLQRATPEQASAIAVLPHLHDGYRAAAHALLACRSRLLKSGGWLNTLERAHAPRVLVRTTLAYALVLSRSLFPDHLQSSIERRTALRVLLAERPHLLGAGPLPNAVADAEIEALFHLDLPRFTLRRGTSRTLEPGSILLPRLGATTLASTVRRRLEALSEESLETIHLPALTLACLFARG